MSMISSLDALEAATDATTAPRAAVFQPKVKPRARKGGGGGETKSFSAKPPPAPTPREKAVLASADPSPLATPAENVATASELSMRALVSENAVPIVDIKINTAEESFACEDGTTPTTDDVAVASMQDNAPGGLEASAERFIAKSDRVPTDEIPRVQDRRPPVAVRSNFPLPAAATRGTLSDEDVGVTGRSSPERDGEVRVASEPSCSQDEEKSDSAKSQNPNSPKRSKIRRAGLKKQAVEDSGPPAKDTIEEEEEGGGRGDGGDGEEPAIAEVEEETETVSEDVTTSKRGRKRKFSHSTSQPRLNRPDRDGVALKIDFSKTDLSNPAKLTMREIIKRAEAIERKKLKAEWNKKFAQNDGKQKQAAIVEAPLRDEVSMAPQVQVINGRIVINERSLTVGAYATSRLNTETYTRVEENAPRLNYNSYRDKTPTERWKAEDTDVFYLALKQFGTDFELIQNLFPGRTRRQVKAKFKKEERNNPRRLQEALAHRPKDQAHYTDMISRLKADEPDPTADDPFANILAYTSNAAAVFSNL